MELNFEGLEMWTWFVQRDRALVPKISRRLIFCIFSWWKQKNQPQIGQKNYLFIFNMKWLQKKKEKNSKEIQHQQWFVNYFVYEFSERS